MEDMLIQHANARKKCLPIGKFGSEVSLNMIFSLLVLLKWQKHFPSTM
jgi:hypothetical protein